MKYSLDFDSKIGLWFLSYEHKPVMRSKSLCRLSMLLTLAIQNEDEDDAAFSKNDIIKFVTDNKLEKFTKKDILNGMGFDSSSYEFESAWTYLCQKKHGLVEHDARSKIWWLL